LNGQEEFAVSDDLVTGQSGEQEPRQPVEVEAPQEGGFALRVYKPGQGYYTRMGTAIGIGVLAVCGAYFLMTQLESSELSASYRLPLQYGIPTAFLIAVGVVIYWLVGLSRRANDFFIATEGEMKKVRWSSRKELTRSTKVVIVTVAVLGIFLFLCDVGFMLVFQSIGVLKGVPTLTRLFGSES
jgi:preprotein translocase subunit SecE